MTRSALLTIPELAARLRSSKRSAYRVARDVGLAGDGQMLVRERDVERWVVARMRGPRDRRHPLAEIIAEDAVVALRGLGTCCHAEGITYFVAYGASLIKIGRVRDRLASRLAHLQAQSPVPIVLLRIARGDDIEQRLHARFRSERAHGEWFDAAPLMRFLERSPGCLRCAMGKPQ